MDETCDGRLLAILFLAYSGLHSSSLYMQSNKVICYITPPVAWKTRHTLPMLLWVTKKCITIAWDEQGKNIGGQPRPPAPLEFFFFFFFLNFFFFPI